jgi:hypothetical protein
MSRIKKDDLIVKKGRNKNSANLVHPIFYCLQDERDEQDKNG